MRSRIPKLLLLVAAVSLVVGCDGVPLPPEPPSTAAVLRAFLGPNADAVESSEVAGRPLDVYVDASGSMRGFVGNSDSVYRLAVDSVLDHAVTSGYEVQTYGFSNGVFPAGGPGSAWILAPEFYGGAHTSFPALFEHITARRESGAVSLVVSDLVQSVRQSDQRALAEAFREFATGGPEALLLGFRSSFQGGYYVEGHRAGTVLRLDLDGREPARSRPFYVLLIAPSRGVLERARSLLLSGIAGQEEFDAASPALALDGIEFLPPDPGSPQIWNVYRPKETLAPGSLTPRSLLSFMELTAPRADSSPLRLRLRLARQPTGAQSVLLHSPGRLEFEVQRRALRGRRWGPREDLRQFAPEALVLEDESALDLNYRFRRPAQLSWDAYRIRVLPGAGNLRLPAWVDEWSALDDSLEMWGNRTLKLDLFMEALTRAIREQTAFSEHYILLGRGA